MKSLILSFIFITTSTCILAFPEFRDTSKITPWLGEFSGTLNITKASNPSSQVPMKVVHFKTDSLGIYGWQIIYGEDEEKGRRAYLLRTVDASKGHYVVDEQNSIFLDTYMFGNKLISDFEVEGTNITSIYTLVDENTISFEIIAGKTDLPNITGGKEDIPKVSTFPLNAYQFATLKRVVYEDK